MRLENKQNRRGGAIAEGCETLILKSFEEMEKRVAAASPGDVFLVSGEEHYQSARLLDILRKKAGELSLETARLCPDDMGEVNLRALFSEGSLFSSGKLVVISDVDKLPKTDRNDLQAVTESGSEHILFARTAGRKTSSNLIKSLEKTGVGFTCWDPFPNSMWLWTKRLSGEEGISFTRDGAQAAEAIASGRLARLAEVVTRVALFHGKGRKASASDVYAAVKGVSETSAFQFCQEALSGRKKDAMVSLSLLLLSGEEPIRLLALFYSQWKQVAGAGEMIENGIPPQAAASKLGIPGFRWKAVEAMARKRSIGATYSALEAFASADHSLKSGGDPLVSIASVVLTLTTG